MQGRLIRIGRPYSKASLPVAYTIDEQAVTVGLSTFGALLYYLDTNEPCAFLVPVLLLIVLSVCSNANANADPSE